ncbi:CBO0543 family protein [Halalkalibacter alkaliphilus]|uniref:Uncharacterized protein n=1 Tax=Halalkalibacter alkaliphilus TaxID=2917993 RepID=A0A9X2CVJ3_9BACI|nr:CBO0543 family protein [Halalkalibacter alkaliphilus]MCL7749043.1 hypothetical protein [Halalkalibacter alkaliphilus]
MKERVILNLGIIFGILSFPTLFKRPSVKFWLPLFIVDGLVNYAFDKTLVKTKKLKYPVRFLPKKFEINVIYDFLVCPILSVWYCQSTYNSKLPGIIGKLMLFGIPQAVYEIWLERCTKALKFKGGWTWVHSMFAVFIVKIISRIFLEICKRKKVEG